MDYIDYEKLVLGAYNKHLQSPYQDLWKKFTQKELIDYAMIKCKRASLIDNKEKIKDDIEDAINLLVFALALSKQ